MDYPKHWWQPADKSTAPEWEILPQEAGKGEVILSKRNELGILSNFAPTAFVFHGKEYKSLEGFWQAMLYPEDVSDPRALFPGLAWKFTRDEVTQMTAFEAKHAGELASENMKKMGIRWVSFEGRQFDYKSQEKGPHYQIIHEALVEKLRQNPKVQEILMMTRGLVLRPDHHEEEDAPPEWHYYKIWMELRDTL